MCQSAPCNNCLWRAGNNRQKIHGGKTLGTYTDGMYGSRRARSFSVAMEKCASINEEGFKMSFSCQWPLRDAVLESYRLGNYQSLLRWFIWLVDWALNCRLQSGVEIQRRFFLKAKIPFGKKSICFSVEFLL